MSRQIEKTNLPELTFCLLLLQVFGTVVNWRFTVIKTLQEHASLTLSDASLSLPSATRMSASNIDWVTFAQEWRDSYTHFTRSYDSQPSTPTDAKSTFKIVDQHHHDSLIELLASHGLADLWSADEILAISRVWHILEPWPDSSSGLASINRLELQTCTLSNGNLNVLKDLAAYGHLQWTHFFSAEHFEAYKPSPKVYLGAVEKLGLKPEECAMVAAHLGDLKAAKECGLQTIYVEREMEEDWSRKELEAAKKENWVTCWVGRDDGEEGMKGLLEVARRLLYMA